LFQAGFTAIPEIARNSQSGADRDAFSAQIAIAGAHPRANADSGEVFKKDISPPARSRTGTATDAEAPTDNIDSFAQFRTH